MDKHKIIGKILDIPNTNHYYITLERNYYLKLDSHIITNNYQTTSVLYDFDGTYVPKYQIIPDNYISIKKDIHPPQTHKNMYAFLQLTIENYQSSIYFNSNIHADFLQYIDFNKVFNVIKKQFIDKLNEYINDKEFEQIFQQPLENFYPSKYPISLRTIYENNNY